MNHVVAVDDGSGLEVTRRDPADGQFHLAFSATCIQREHDAPDPGAPCRDDQTPMRTVLEGTFRGVQVGEP